MIGEEMTAYESEKETIKFLQEESDSNLADLLANQRQKPFCFSEDN
jgi:hypothetical protein